MKKVTLSKLPNGELFVPLKHFEGLVDLNVVKYYDCEVDEATQSVVVTFYDDYNNKVDIKCEVDSEKNSKERA